MRRPGIRHEESEATPSISSATQTSFSPIPSNIHKSQKWHDASKTPQNLASWQSREQIAQISRYDANKTPQNLASWHRQHQTKQKARRFASCLIVTFGDFSGGGGARCNCSYMQLSHKKRPIRLQELLFSLEKQHFIPFLKLLAQEMAYSFARITDFTLIPRCLSC